MIRVTPFLVDHPTHGRLVVLGLVDRGTLFAIVANDELGLVPITELTVAQPARDWPAGWEPTPPSPEEP